MLFHFAHRLYKLQGCLILHLKHSILISLLLHLTIAVAVRSPIVHVASPTAPQLQPAIPQPALTVSLPKKIPQATTTQAAMAVPRQASPITTITTVASRARFITEPNLGQLEQFASQLQAPIRLSLTVSQLGFVKGVQALPGTALPAEFLNNVQKMLSQTRLQPALNPNGLAVTSELVIIIGVEPGPEPLIE